MRTLRELGKFTGLGPPISLRPIGNYVTKRGEPISMRAVIQRLQSLPPITLEAQPETTSGEVPLSVAVHVQPSVGVVLETRANVLRPNGEVVATWTWSGSDYAAYNFAVPGSYFFNITRTGIISTGRTQLTKSFPISARAKVVPPPQPSKPVISVKSNGDGSFVVSGSGFSASATVHIRIVDATLNTFWVNQTATAQGTLEYPTGKICQRAGQVFFSANDGRSDSHDSTGTLWSNTATTTCPG
ncbi:hypothetical protein [Hymenobacter sp. GOD-10R]|uniref:hypothetical protein n=1 Tax=Hymenobacter sp. GOD-10R TaxID=3093922 RepID=UPI002D777137|nr:hypothetical protein [Hymenobacter sp. GOD-10R]WRQ27681.1 hypothetical protein SD425_21660 [Hymenobacter sp. GOD-10R]